MHPVFLPDAKLRPYWWEETPPETAGGAALPADMPRRVDVAVVGAGYTGLHAALQVARAGRSVVVLDAQAPGWGCSTRNGGQISTSIKPGFAELSRRHGAETAAAVLRDGQASLDWVERFVTEEGIDCAFRRCGRFHAAHSRRAYDRLAASLESQQPGFEVPYRLVPRDRQQDELATEAYFGGAVYDNHASLDPGRYHAGLMRKLREAGGTILGHCPVTAIRGETGDLRLATGQGELRCREAVLATNGYGGALSPWHRRRVIPIGSYMVATEELPQGLVETLIPRDRVISDTRRVVYYFRASPDRRRILFGGRVSAGETDPARSGPRLHREMVRLFPQLAGTRLSHSWMGTVAYSFDTLAHAGQHEGVHYAMGYCGSGVGMASYLGMRIGRRIRQERQGHEELPAGLEALPFPTRPLYRGRPWFLGPAVTLFRLRDATGL